MRNKLNVLFICGWYPSRVLTNNGDFIQRHAEAVSLKQNVSVLHIITDENSRIVYKWVDIDENGKGRAVRKTYISFETGDLYKIIKVDMKVDIRHYKYEDDRGEHYY